jgi:site-specific DNA-cytosine methylase
MNVLSLFDGMACGRQALKNLKMDVGKGTYYSSEIDKYSSKVAKDNHPDRVELGDITNWGNWGIDWSSIDLLFAGFPCQAWSFAERGALAKTLLDILNHLKSVNPNIKFLFENVVMKKSNEEMLSGWFGVEAVEINSSLVSAQNRRRLYWCNWDIPEIKDREVTLESILEYDVPDKYYHTQKAIDYMNKVGSTGRIKWSYLFHSDTNNNKSACVTANFFKGVPNNVLVCGRTVGRKINPETGKRDDYNSSLKAEQRFEARRDRKTGTITTVMKDNELGVDGFPVSVRKFTPLELERLQTLPEGYTEGVSDTQRSKMIGNGWNVKTIEEILRGLFD